MSRKKKNTTLNLKIYKKVCELVRIETIFDEEGYPINYLVQSRRTKRDEWRTNLETISFKKAIQKKHFQVLIAIRDLGYRQDFLLRRKNKRNR